MQHIPVLQQFSSRPKFERDIFSKAKILRNLYFGTSVYPKPTNFMSVIFFCVRNAFDLSETFALKQKFVPKFDINIKIWLKIRNVKIRVLYPKSYGKLLKRFPVLIFLNVEAIFTV